MKISSRKMFVLLVVIISLVAVQAVWAKGGPDCTTVVGGTVSQVLVDDNAIVVDGETVYGIPLPWVDIEIDDLVLINAHECPDTGRLMACYLTVNGTLIELRPRAPK
jgi:hypothetical protein